MSNHLTLTGNVVRDPELRYTAGGTPRVVMPVASTRRFQPKGADQATEATSFFTVIIWGELGEHAAESLAKGDRVTVSGRVEQRTWLDEAQQRHTSFDIVADDVAASLRFRTAKIDRTERVPASSGFGFTGGDAPSGDGVGVQSPSFEAGGFDPLGSSSPLPAESVLGGPQSPSAEAPFDEFAVAS